MNETILQTGAPLTEAYDAIRQNTMTGISRAEIIGGDTRYGSRNPYRPSVTKGRRLSTILEKYKGPFAINFDYMDATKISINVRVTDARVFGGYTPVTMNPLMRQYIRKIDDEDCYYVENIMLPERPTDKFELKIWLAVYICDPQGNPLNTLENVNNFRLYWNLAQADVIPDPTRFAFIRPLGRIVKKNGAIETEQWWTSNWVYIDGRVA